MFETGLRNLYTALLMGGALQSDNFHYSVEVEQKKVIVLENYLKLAQLREKFKYTYDELEKKLLFDRTPLLIKLHKEWSKDLLQIEYVSPAQLNVNVFNLWITLFHQLKNKKMYMPSKHFTTEARETLGVLYTEIMRYSINHNHLYFITDYREYFIQSYENRRPLYEMYSLIEVLGPKEICTLSRIRTDYDMNRGVQGL